MEYLNTKKKGFTLFYAMLISSLLLAVGLAVLNITFKEFVLSTGARDSETAFYAADSALECALYWDYKQRPFGYYGDSLAKGLLGYWRFEEDSDLQRERIVIDTSGEERHGRVGEDFSWTEGKFGNGAYFNRSKKSVVDIVDSKILELKDDFTISLWHKGVPNDGEHKMIMGGRGNSIESAGQKFGFISIEEDKKFKLKYFVRINDREESDSVYVQSSDLTSWQFVGLRRKKNGVVSISINGGDWQDLFRGTPQLGTFYVTGLGYARSQIGKIQFFEGNLDDVRVYNRALSDSEISAMYELRTEAEFVPPVDVNESGSLVCAGDNINDSSGWWVGADGETGWHTEKINKEGEPDKWKTTFDIILPDPMARSTKGRLCAVVTVIKGANVLTEIISRGYNTCDVSDKRTLQRAIRATY